jgi:glycyl-tRNA synthetase beta chain
VDGKERVGGMSASVTDFLLELRSEEIPARMQDKARADLARLFGDELAKAGLKVETVETYATPRRLALIAKGLPLETAAVSEETKGPKTSAPPQALEGFLRKTGLTQDQLEERDGIYFAVVEKPGRKTADVLAEAIPAIIRAFPWPKSMRWGAASASTESLRWVRPLQGIVALLGDAVVPCQLPEISAGSTTTGHRFHHSGLITIGNAADYAMKLRAAHVIVDQDERRAIIRAGAEKAARAAGLVLVPDEGLVAENAGLTEWPVPMLGRFDPAFLEVPEEVIQLTARVNQKYFICRDGAGKLANAFVCTANLEPSDGGATVVAGNEKVLAARLSDAKFFWEQDLKVRLEDQAAKLSQIVFHEKLGTVADKVERVAKLARWLVESGVVKSSPSLLGEGDHPQDGGGAAGATGGLATAAPPSAAKAAATPPSKLGGDLTTLAETAARLCKADLVTGMVGEFPELQGVMGGYYARAQGHVEAIADAIRDHYKPVGQGDDVPTAPVTVAVSLADKLDTLAGFFGANILPTGSRDPFALRRAALALIQICVTNKIRLPIIVAVIAMFEDFNQENYDGLNQRVIGLMWRDRDNKENWPDVETYIGQLWSIVTRPMLDFFADRLKVQQREAGVRHDLIDAVFALGGEDDLVRLLARVKALQAFVGTDAGANLLAGYKRAGNILKQNPSPLEGEGGPQGRVRGSTEGGSMPPKAISTEAQKTLSAADAAGPSPALRAPSPARGEGLEVELTLQSALDTAEPLATSAIEREDFEGAMSALSTLRAPIDAFFEGVMVNDPDPQKRAYRIGLLERFVSAVHRVADFSKIEG